MEIVCSGGEHYEFVLRSIRTEHLDDFYTGLIATGGQHGDGLGTTTVDEVHPIVRSALTQTTEHVRRRES